MRGKLYSSRPVKQKPKLVTYKLYMRCMYNNLNFSIIKYNKFWIYRCFSSKMLLDKLILYKFSQVLAIICLDDFNVFQLLKLRIEIMSKTSTKRPLLLSVFV